METISGYRIIQNVEYEKTDTVYDMILKLRHECILNLIYNTEILGNNMAIESCIGSSETKWIFIRTCIFRIEIKKLYWKQSSKMEMR